MAKATTKQKKTPPRTDGRRPLTTYMAPDMVKQLKMAALQEDRNAYEILEEAVGQWLERRRKQK
jgi:hypothetical protein